MASRRTKKAKRFFIVNPAGAVHECTEDHARARLRVVGWRMATKKEAEQYLSQDIQRHDRPIAEPWSPEPTAIEVEGVDIDESADAAGSEEES